MSLSKNVLALTTSLYLICLLSFGAEAQIQLFTDERDFMAHAGRIVTETFDEYGVGSIPGKSIQLGGVQYAPADPLEDPFWQIGTNYNPISPPNTLQASNIVAQRLTFTSPQAPRAVGFSMLIPDSPTDTTAWQHFIVVDDVNGNHIQLEITSPQGDRQHYFGFIANAGIEDILVRYAHFPEETGINGGSNWAYDNVSVSATPEPVGSVVMITSICLCILMLFRHQRSKADCRSRASGKYHRRVPSTLRQVDLRELLETKQA